MRVLARRSVLIAGAAFSALCAGCPGRPETPPAPPAEVTVAAPLKKRIQPYAYATGTTEAVGVVNVRAEVQGRLVEQPFRDGQVVRGRAKPMVELLPRPEPEYKLKNVPKELLAEEAAPPKPAGVKEPEGKPALPQPVEEPLAAGESPRLLFVIDKRPFLAAVAKAKAELDKRVSDETGAAIKLDKLEEALKASAVAEVDVIQARADYRSARAAVNSAAATWNQARFDLGNTDIHATASGRISKGAFAPGNIVGPATQTPLAVIYRETPLYVGFNVAQREILDIRAARIRAGETTAADRGDLPVEIGLENEEGYPHVGRFFYADPTASPTTGTIYARGIFENADNALFSGLHCRVRVPIGAAYDAVVVPERALGTDQGQRYVFVVNAKNEVEYRVVKVGVLEDGFREIRDGLKADERIIVNGLQRVRPGAVVVPKEQTLTLPTPRKKKA